jgi:hypothetical protein
MRRFKVSFGLVLLMLSASMVFATVPKLINFQGVLRTPADTVVSDDSYSVTFTIYNAPTGGINLWTETQSVTTTEGLFAVLLGSSNPVPDSVFQGSDRWLGIAVVPDGEMPQRQQLVSVGYAYRVNSVDGASGGTITSKVSIGLGHTNTGNHAFVAGVGNTVSGDRSNVGGGYLNTASGIFATVSGGDVNTASSFAATVGGGEGNTASGAEAAVAGGGNNAATNTNATIGGGKWNKAGGQFSVVSGGGGTLPADSNSALADYSAIGGGLRNKTTGLGSSISGGVNNTASGNPSSIGGGSANSANFDYSTVGGGFTNSANAGAATVAGGMNNIASGQFGFVGGGRFDTVSGQYAAVPGGYASKASGDYSLAAGQQAKAIHNGSFVWADDRSADFASTATRQFSIRAQNGVRLADTAGAAKAVTIGEYYRDNGIIAWGRVDGFSGTLNADYGVSSFTKNSTGNYTINLNAVAVNFNNIIPVASIELNVPPDGIAANIRHIFVDQVTASQFSIHITNGSYVPADSYFTFIVTGR